MDVCSIASLVETDDVSVYGGARLLDGYRTQMWLKPERKSRSVSAILTLVHFGAVPLVESGLRSLTADSEASITVFARSVFLITVTVVASLHQLSSAPDIAH